MQAFPSRCEDYAQVAARQTIRAATIRAAVRSGQETAGSKGTSSSATMLMILMSGLTAGPAVSL